VTEHDGTGIATSQLRIELGRGDLGTKLECRASSPTLSTPMLAWVEVDVSGEFHIILSSTVVSDFNSNEEIFSLTVDFLRIGVSLVRLPQLGIG